MVTNRSHFKDVKRMENKEFMQGKEELTILEELKIMLEVLMEQQEE